MEAIEENIQFEIGEPITWQMPDIKRIVVGEGLYLKKVDEQMSLIQCMYRNGSRFVVQMEVVTKLLKRTNKDLTQIQLQMIKPSVEQIGLDDYEELKKQAFKGHLLEATSLLEIDKNWPFRRQDIIKYNSKKSTVLGFSKDGLICYIMLSDGYVAVPLEKVIKKDQYQLKAKLY